jgi:hypothetical protein
MKHIKLFEEFLNEANDLSYWKDYADGSSQSPKWYSNDAKNPSAVNKLVDAVVNHELDELDDKDADIDPSDMKALTNLAMKYFKRFGSINGHIVSAMLFQEAKESFMNEDRLNEGMDGFSILSIGSIQTKTGKSKYFNVYDEWAGQVKTVEVYKELKPTPNMINLVITSGASPIKNKNGKEPVEGDERSFINDQNRRPLFTGNFLGSIQLNDLKTTDFFKKMGMNSDTFKAYVYK